MNMLRAIIEVGFGFYIEEFQRNVARYGVVGTFHKKSRGRHCRQGRVSRSERVRNMLIKDSVVRASWTALHSLSAASSYVCRAPEVVADLQAARRIALERMIVELQTPGLRNQRIFA